MQKKKRVLIVDDSAVIRGMIARMIQDEPDIEIVGSASNGQMAVQMYMRERPDLVLLDIEMPIMDGMEALKQIMQHDRSAKVVMCSTLTHKNAEISMQALALGAIDYLPKPESAREINASENFKQTLIRMVRSIAARGAGTSYSGGSGTSASPPAPPPTAHRPSTPPPSSTPPSTPRPAGDANTYTASSSPAPLASGQATPSSIPNIFKGEVTKRAKPPSNWVPKIVAIGSSTGGPQALFAALKPLKNLPVPIVITQHMPATFTALLAQHIFAQTGIECFEGAENMPIENGKAYIAPGGKHMLLRKGEDGRVVIKIDDGPMENFCKPSVDPMLRSTLAIYGSKTLGVILTGMGTDGLEGMRQLVDAGGYLVAQDAETSVVWGMPGAVSKAGLCSEILPVQEIGSWVYKIVTQ